MGVLVQDAIQQITITGTSACNEGEFFEVEVPGYIPPFKVYYDPNITAWTGNFQTAIRAVEGLSEVVVTGEGVIPTTASETLDVVFTVYFGGHDTRDGELHMQAARHDIPLMVITDNTLLLGTAIVLPTPVQQGSPVNTTAETIPDEITAPTGIPFIYPYIGNPLLVGSLQPGEFVPIWIRRTLPIVDPYYGPLARNGQMAKLLESFTIQVDATSP
jgi:hypothetical protein